MWVLRRGLDGLYGVCTVLAGICLAAIAAIILAGAIARLFGTLVPSASELSGYLVVASTFLGLAPTLRSGGHIRVELFASRLGPRARRWLEIWCLVAGLILIGFLAYASIELIVNSFTNHVTSSGLLPVPLWIPQVSMVLGLVVMAVALFELLVNTLAGHQPSYHELSIDVADQEGQP